MKETAQEKMTDEKPPTFEANVLNEPAMEEEEQRAERESQVRGAIAQEGKEKQ